ncbi:hypothetical protein F5888DRAFT_1900700 [Russula emetica]|nr:hypothetical protein F5888DRAFT_1900700 [Russula emetica]
MNSSSSSSLTTFATTPTRTTSYEKSAEFARLYYFFEKLTQPRSRERIQEQESTLSRETTADGSVPEDIAPLLKNLSAILTKDEPEDGDTLGTGEAQVSIPDTPMTALASTFAITSPPPPTPTFPNSADHASTRPRRYTVAGSSVQAQAQTGPSVRTSVRQSTSTVVHQTRFPLGVKRYPFTFKLLLHKLYDLEDWAAKVQEVLATSQEQFRSLNSTPSSNSGSGSSGDGGISDGAPLRSPSSSPGGVTFTSPLFGTPSSPLESPPGARRRRAQSTSKTKANDNVSRSGPGMTARPLQPSRAVKRRIVNRRRSTNGLGIGKLGEWMYDAAVSSIDAENVDARGQGSLRRRKRVISSVGFVEEERRCVIRDVTNASF